jgi:hypothetical protein
MQECSEGPRPSPVHTVRVAITARTAVAIGSCATRRYDENIRLSWLTPLSKSQH